MHRLAAILLFTSCSFVAAQQPARQRQTFRVHVPQRVSVGIDYDDSQGKDRRVKASLWVETTVPTGIVARVEVFDTTNKHIRRQKDVPIDWGRSTISITSNRDTTTVVTTILPGS